jgi:hypothetical protein
VLPVAIVGGVGAEYLRDLPAGATSHLLEAAGVAAGLLFGLAAVAFIKVGKDPADGRLTTTAAWPYATTWIAALALPEPSGRTTSDALPHAPTDSQNHAASRPQSHACATPARASPRLGTDQMDLPRPSVTRR